MTRTPRFCSNGCRLCVLERVAVNPERGVNGVNHTATLSLLQLDILQVQLKSMSLPGNLILSPFVYRSTTSPLYKAKFQTKSPPYSLSHLCPASYLRKFPSQLLSAFSLYQRRQIKSSLFSLLTEHRKLIMPTLNYALVSRISARASSPTSLAILGFSTGVILTLLVALVIWLVYRRR
jgi:hypothetical protein